MFPFAEFTQRPAQAILRFDIKAAAGVCDMGNLIDVVSDALALRDEIVEKRKRLLIDGAVSDHEIAHGIAERRAEHLGLGDVIHIAPPQESLIFLVRHAYLHGMRAILLFTGVLILLHGILRPRFFRFGHRGGCTIREMKAGFGEGTPQQGSDRKGPILRNRKIWATGRYLL